MTTKKTSFKKSKANVDEASSLVAPEAVSQASCLPCKKGGLVDPAIGNSSLPAIGGLQGDFAEEDFRLPRINIVQAVGPLSEDFEPGSIVYNKDLVLLEPGKDPKVWSDPLQVTVLNAKKQFQENLDYGVEEMPETVDTLEEVQERGGWLDWRGDEKPPWRPMLTVLLLIEAPSEAMVEEFSIQGNDGKAYELALWTLKGSAYSRAGKAINTAARFALRNKETGEPELHKGRWTLQVRREKLGTNLVYVPRLRQHGKHDDGFVEFITTLL